MSRENREERREKKRERERERDRMREKRRENLAKVVPTKQDMSVSMSLASWHQC